MANDYPFRGKALSVVQPWADAIAFAGKTIENRSWQTHYRGPLAIHASGSTSRLGDLDMMVRAERGGEKRPLRHWISKGRRRYGLEPLDTCETSRIVAIAMLVDCIEKSSSPWYQRGGWGWVLEGIVPIEPVKKKGTLGVWDCSFRFRPLKR